MLICRAAFSKKNRTLPSNIVSSVGSGVMGVVGRAPTAACCCCRLGMAVPGAVHGDVAEAVKSHPRPAATPRLRGLRWLSPGPPRLATATKGQTLLRWRRCSARGGRRPVHLDAPRRRLFLAAFRGRRGAYSVRGRGVGPGRCASRPRGCALAASPAPSGARTSLGPRAAKGTPNRLGLPRPEGALGPLGLAACLQPRGPVAAAGTARAWRAPPGLQRGVTGGGGQVAVGGGGRHPTDRP